MLGKSQYLSDVLCILILLETGGKGEERNLCVELTHCVPGTLLDAMCIHTDIFICLYNVISLCLHSVYNHFADDNIVVSRD